MPANSTTFDLSDQVTLVTGPGSGLGAATSRLLAEPGARVILADINKEAAGGVAARFGGGLCIWTSRTPALLKAGSQTFWARRDG